ncbi:MAG: hypothetical protein E4G71_04015 [Candidatus Atribacteria bacterium]|nr:MAG: hypothetical protein E4G71_04015 [Candidatus Atribacteria bacterium]
MTPAEGEGEGEGEGEICPTLEVTSQVAVGGKTYIKGGNQTITVTFANPTEPVSVYVGGSLSSFGIRNNPEGIPDDAIEVVMYPDEEKKIYTGTFNFNEVNFLVATLEAKQGPIANFCAEDYIYVSTCDTCDPCKYPYIVDIRGPESKITITPTDCPCEGCTLLFESTPTDPECGESEECCGDDCSALASWSIDIYDEDPFNECCNVPCIEPIDSCSGTSCPISCESICLETGIYKIVITLVDLVGNKTRYYGNMELIDLPTDCVVFVTQYSENISGCTDWGWGYQTQDNTLGSCNSQLN